MHVRTAAAAEAVASTHTEKYTHTHTWGPHNFFSPFFFFFNWKKKKSRLGNKNHIICECGSSDMFPRMCARCISQLLSQANVFQSWTATNRRTVGYAAHTVAQNARRVSECTCTCTCTDTRVKLLLSSCGFQGMRILEGDFQSCCHFSCCWSCLNVMVWVTHASRQRDVLLANQ